MSALYHLPGVIVNMPRGSGKLSYSPVTMQEAISAFKRVMGDHGS